MNHAATKTFNLLLLFTFFCIPACSKEPPAPDPPADLSQSVQVDWTWKRTVDESTNMIYGTVKNTSDQPLKQVELEFRTQNEEGKTLTARAFVVNDLSAGAQKPFTQDYPAQSAREDSGFVVVKNVIPADSTQP